MLEEKKWDLETFNTNRKIGILYIHPGTFMNLLGWSRVVYVSVGKRVRSNKNRAGTENKKYILPSRSYSCALPTV